MLSLFLNLNQQALLSTVAVYPVARQLTINDVQRLLQPWETAKESCSAPSQNTVDPFPSKKRSPRFHGERLLPPSFKPSQNSVICGRGKDCYASVGNLRLREIVLSCLPKYSNATGKKEKSEIVSAIMQHVLESCPGRVGAFVKIDKLGRWYEVGDQVARERISSIFRDFLHSAYRSSSKSRVSRRQKNRERQQNVSSPKKVVKTESTK